jgi:hypothetical protein
VKKLFILRDPVQAHKVFQESLWQYCKAMLIAGHVLEVNVGDLKRNNEQNALLHALLTDISVQVEWAGKKHSVIVWKRLLTAAWLRATGENVEIYPAIDGKGIDIVYEQTSKLSVKQCADLITYIEAFGADKGVVWSLHD